jgi:hypothetical protein
LRSAAKTFGLETQFLHRFLSPHFPSPHFF